MGDEARHQIVIITAADGHLLLLFLENKFALLFFFLTYNYVMR